MGEDKSRDLEEERKGKGREEEGRKGAKRRRVKGKA